MFGWDGIAVEMPIGSVTVREDQVPPDFQFRRILVLADFSRGAKSALECARSIARKFQSKIFLLHVIPSGLFQFISEESAKDVLVRAKEFVEREMQHLVNDPGAQDLRQEGIVAEGAVWPTVSEAIKTHEIDLITMGTHSGGPEKKLVLGSVADQVYRMADIPILTVPPEIAANQNVKLQRLLFATNFMPHNELAAKAAHSLECSSEGRLTVLHVIEEPSESSLESHNIVKDFLIKRMKKELPPAREALCKRRFEVRFGKPVEEILSASNQLQSELILLGLRTRQRAAGHLPSALAYSVVCQATCPVLSLHQK